MGACLDKGTDLLNDQLGTDFTANDLISGASDLLFNLPEEKKKRTILVIGSPGYDCTPIVEYIKTTYKFEELSVVKVLEANPLYDTLKASSDMLTKMSTAITQAFRVLLLKYGQKVIISGYPKTKAQLEGYLKDCGGQTKIVGVIYVNWGDKSKWLSRLTQQSLFGELQAQLAIDEFLSETAEVFGGFESEGKLVEFSIGDQFDKAAKEKIDKIMREKGWDL